MSLQMASQVRNHSFSCNSAEIITLNVIKVLYSRVLTYTTEEHSEVHDSDGPPPTSVVIILRVIAADMEYRLSIKDDIPARQCNLYE